LERPRGFTGRPVDAVWSQGDRLRVENDPNQTLQATVGEAFFLMFFGVSAGFGFSMSFGKPHRA